KSPRSWASQSRRCNARLQKRGVVNESATTDCPAVPDPRERYSGTVLRKAGHRAGQKAGQSPESLATVGFFEACSGTLGGTEAGTGCPKGVGQSQGGGTLRHEQPSYRAAQARINATHRGSRSTSRFGLARGYRGAGESRS